ncbi:hypothetical protein QBC40DRAFT_174072 [Triangularia verruculosa]|uniref:Annexin n=1 Tax=Triangularia verruculosa TaxID=2587418 RepID=A0AAN6XGQ6_9PEZI|nr:hypothetical protein QBC40DRAFT_174072 [Triangularia verruculosa]
MPTVTPESEDHESKPILTQPSIITSTVPTAIQGPIQIPQGGQSSITAASSTSSKVVYPKPPKVSEDAMFFRCPCCFQTLPVTSTQHSRWRKHLSGDIQPYTCILEDRPKPLQLYATRKEWTQHMREEHEVTKYWLCSACLDPTRFDVESHFHAHLRTQHGDVVLEDQIPIFVSMSTYTSSPSFTCCPLCPPQQDGEEVDTDVLLDHAAEHVHSFSLQSLPWPIPEEGEREYLGLGPDDLLDHVDFFDVASGPDSADGSRSSISRDSRNTDKTSEPLDLAFRDENPDVPWEPYRGDGPPPQLPIKKKVPFQSYNPADDAARIAAVLKPDRVPPDTRPLIDILPNRTNHEIMQIRSEYQRLVKTGLEMKGVNVAKHIRTCLRGVDLNFMLVCYATALGQWESEASWITYWYQRDKTQKQFLVDAFFGRTNDEIRLIEYEFRDSEYDNSLQACLHFELGEGIFKEAVMMVLEKKGMEEADFDTDLVYKDAKELRASVRVEKGGEDQIVRTIIQRSDRHLREILKVYGQLFQGEDFAREAVRRCMNIDRDGSRHELLISRLVRYHWDKSHMQEVKKAYHKKYGLKLQDAVQEATSAEFGEFCVALCGSD